MNRITSEKIITFLETYSEELKHQYEMPMCAIRDWIKERRTYIKSLIADSHLDENTRPYTQEDENYYPIELKQQEPNFWEACIPLLGRWACVAVGKTPEEALSNLALTRKVIMKELKEQNLPSPLLPQNTVEEKCLAAIEAIESIWMSVPTNLAVTTKMKDMIDLIKRIMNMEKAAQQTK